MKPVWDDADQDGTSGDHLEGPSSCKRRRELYRVSTTGGEPAWAKLQDKEAEEEAPGKEEGDAFRAMRQMVSSAGYFTAKSRTLPAKQLKFSQLRDVSVGHQKGAVTSVKFHPLKPVLVTATTAGTISLFEICKDNNNLDLNRGSFFLQDVYFPRFRLDNIDFFDEGMSLLASSTNQNHCFTYDLISGKVATIKQPIVMDSFRTRLVRLSADGTLVACLANMADIFVFHLKTMDHLHTFRGAERFVDFVFAPFDRNTIFALAENGAVYSLDLRRRADLRCFFDHGCVRAKCVACSQTGQFIACGSNTGIVNVYDLATIMSSSSSANPQPLHTLSQLTTSIDFVRFSPYAQMMTFGSAVKHMAGRLAHCSTGTVFQNFPAKQEFFSRDRLIVADFSPNNAFFVMGTKQGTTRLYRLNHFETY